MIKIARNWMPMRVSMSIWGAVFESMEADGKITKRHVTEKLTTLIDLLHTKGVLSDDDLEKNFINQEEFTRENDPDVIP